MSSPITITLDKDREEREFISMPVDIRVSPNERLRWEIRIGANAVTVPWLVSFRDGTVFDVVTYDPKQAKTPAGTTRSPDVRNGQEVSFAGALPGRYSYRFAFEHDGKIYGVFDCPSIIIT